MTTTEVRGNSHVFPVKGKIMEKVEICMTPEYHSISISFQDKHSLTFVINPDITRASAIREVDWRKLEADQAMAGYPLRKLVLRG